MSAEEKVKPDRPGPPVTMIGIVGASEVVITAPVGVTVKVIET